MRTHNDCSRNWVLILPILTKVAQNNNNKVIYNNKTNNHALICIFYWQIYHGKHQCLFPFHVCRAFISTEACMLLHSFHRANGPCIEAIRWHFSWCCKYCPVCIFDSSRFRHFERCVCVCLRACMHVCVIACVPLPCFFFSFSLGHMLFLNDYSESDVINFGSESNHKDIRCKACLGHVWLENVRVPGSFHCGWGGATASTWLPQFSGTVLQRLQLRPHPAGSLCLELQRWVEHKLCDLCLEVQYVSTSSTLIPLLWLSQLGIQWWVEHSAEQMGQMCVCARMCVCVILLVFSHTVLSIIKENKTDNDVILGVMKFKWDFFDSIFLVFVHIISSDSVSSPL